MSSYTATWRLQQRLARGSETLCDAYASHRCGTDIRAQFPRLRHCLSIVFGVGFGLFGIVIGVIECLLIADGVKTSATVVRTDVGLKHDNVIVVFHTRDGQEIRAQASDYEVGAPDVGDTVRIRYEADDPTFITGTGWFAIVINTAIAVCLLYAGFSGGRTGLRRIRRRAGP